MRKTTADKIFRLLFTAVALFSALALGAIVVFLFSQGAMPFLSATAPGLRLVPQRMADLTVNGERYVDHAGFIHLPEGTTRVELSFPFELDDGASGVAGGTESLVFDFDPSARDWEAALDFARLGSGALSSPEAYVFTVSWPGPIAAAAPRLHVLLPEPPYGFWAFLSGRTWQPTIFKMYGIFPMIVATMLAALGAILIGVPLALFCAVFMSEFLPPRIAAIARGGIELLAGIPSVVYGFFGLMVVVPAVRNFFGIPAGNTLLSAIIVLALMILPTITTIAETSLRAVPLAAREASLALGASPMQTAWRVVVPHANSGVIAGVILGMSRAVGETMAVILVAGNSPQLALNPLESARTLTATIALEMGYAAGRHGEMLFSIGVVLFAIILLLNGAILWTRRRAEAS
ncbi:MAG: phosphate ABC transporter permease subunit PstC [Treponema sp.]|nr:phosphate ABC transporter permease subunit PstC [Treponema sp.]